MNDSKLTDEASILAAIAKLDAKVVAIETTCAEIIAARMMEVKP